MKNIRKKKQQLKRKRHRQDTSSLLQMKTCCTTGPSFRDQFLESSLGINKQLISINGPLSLKTSEPGSGGIHDSKNLKILA